MAAGPKKSGSKLPLLHQMNLFCQPIGDGLHRCSCCMATRPQLSQTYFIAASLSLQTWVWSIPGAPQKLHVLRSPQGLHKCPGSSATAPQFLHVYAIGILLSAL
jgi:hypothetical protein